MPQRLEIHIDRDSPIPLYHQLAEQLTAAIERDLKALERLRIKPVFVFNGIRPAMERPFPTDSRSPSGMSTSTET